MSRHAELQTQNIAKDREIIDLPKPFRPSATPYKGVSFNPKVREAASHILGVKVVKAVVVGDLSAGKTRLVQRFCSDPFAPDYKATICVDFEVEKFSILSVPFTMQIWDTAGQERFKSIAASYYRSANAVIVLFEFGNFESLHNARKWKDEACSGVDTENPLVFLVGTQNDLMSESVSENIEHQATALANEIGAEYWAVSLKTGENVKELFFRIAALLFDAAALREIQPASSSRKIGDDLIKVQKGSTDGDAWSRTRNKIKCCQ